MVNVFSFCLYGPDNPRYYRGMLENIFLAGMYFPTWKVYIYHGPDVTEHMINHLSACSSVVLIPTNVLGPANMIHRFYAIDEPGVEVMMVRDADSRIHWKDRWAIRQFLASSQVAHTIRDHKDHTAHIMGGLWGLKKTAGISMRALYASYVEDRTRGHRLAHDQNFLSDALYPIVVGRMLIHRSGGPRFVNEVFVEEFPFTWSVDVFCGRIETEYVDHPQPPPIVRSFLASRTLDKPLPPIPHFLAKM